MGLSRGSARLLRPSVCLLRTCDSTSVKRRRLAPPPLLSHNIRDKVTVCCGLRTLITRQENNVEGKAFHHHQRSLNPPGDSAGLSSGFTPLTRRRVWLTATEQISLNNKREKKAPLSVSFLSFSLNSLPNDFKSECRFSLLAHTHSKSGK